MDSEKRSIDPVQLDLAIGGQAVMEGVMMRCPRSIATAVRTPGGKIVVRRKPYSSWLARLRINRIPLLRGGLHLIESMALGFGAGAALLPVAYYTGDDFQPAKRQDPKGFTYWDAWGATRE